MTDQNDGATRLTAAQRQMLDDIAASGIPEGGRGWTSHSQRRLDSLVRRGLVLYAGGGRWTIALDQTHAKTEDS